MTSDYIVLLLGENYYGKIVHRFVLLILGIYAITHS